MDIQAMITEMPVSMAMLVMVLVSILERAGVADTVGADIKNTPFLYLTAERPCLPGVKTNKEVRFGAPRRRVLFNTHLLPSGL